MKNSQTKTRDNVFLKIYQSDWFWLIAIALLNIITHSVFNGSYGYHRDELATIDDARYLAWGYVAYPPVTPFLARAAFELFGSSLVGLRFFAVLALSVAIILTGLMARDLGGRRFAQILAAISVLVAPIVILQGAVFQYVSFDYLWWVLIAFFFIKLLKTDDARWWIGIGAVIGVGLLTKYTIALFVVGLIVGVLLTRARHFLRSSWLWASVGVAIIIWLPNVIWQINHQFISIDFLRSIHERDVQMGRTGGFLSEQFLICANFVTVPLVFAGIWFYAGSELGAKFRAVFWMFVVPLILFVVLQGRAYYFAPAYPMMFAGGTVLCENWINSLKKFAVSVRATIVLIFLAGGALFSAILLPVAPVNSALWNKANSVHDLFREEIGWDELAQNVSKIYEQIPPDEKPRTAILAGNYGEAGAVNLYGKNQNLPEAISLVNSYWLRGYGDSANPPETVILIGFKEADAKRLFEECQSVAANTNRFGVENEESKEHSQIFLCRKMHPSWKDFWERHRSFG